MKRTVALFTVILFALTGCNAPAAFFRFMQAPTAAPTDTPPPFPTAATPIPTATLPGIDQLVPKILAVYPHDTTAFTEGLILDKGKFYESAGLYGQSTLREVDIKTGKVLQSVKLDPKYFAEGLAVVGNHLIELTWQEHTAIIYDENTFAVVGTLPYDGQGWGLCYDGKALYMSDGSNVITERDPQTFAAIGKLTVTEDGQPVTNLNELECVGDSLYENVWTTDTIVKIDKATGNVTAMINAAGLLTADERAKTGLDGVLNGIAYDPDSQTFYITGKLWPKMFNVVFVPASSVTPTPTP